MSILMRILYFIVEFILEYLIVLFVYTLVSYFQKKFSKHGKGKFSIKETINEAWQVCFVIALVIVVMNHLI